MKKFIKLTLTLACVMCSTSLYAQKFGRINLQEVIFAMPEFKEMQTKIETLSKDWSEQLEAIQVEFNNKYAEFQKALPTMSDTAKQVKESELQGLQNRYTELQQVAQQDVEKQQGELFRPIHEKATDAVKKVASAGSYTAVFDMSANSLAYVNEATVTDISAAVRKELGITETPEAAK